MSDNANTPPVVVGVDGSTSSVEALIRAATIATALHAPLQAIIAWTYPVMLALFDPSTDWSPKADAEHLLQDAMQEAFQGSPPEQFSQSAVPGPAAAVLLEQSDRATMLVVGSRGRGGFSRLLLGSVSASCASHARCPVLIVHTPNGSVG